MRLFGTGASILLSIFLAAGVTTREASAKKPTLTAGKRTEVKLEDRDMAVLKRQQAINEFRKKRVSKELDERAHDVNELNNATGSLYNGLKYGKVELGLKEALTTAQTKHSQAKDASNRFYDGDHKVYREIWRRIDKQTQPLESKLGELNRKYETAHKAEQELGWAVADFKKPQNKKSVDFMEKEGKRLGIKSVTDAVKQLEKQHAEAQTLKSDLGEKIAKLEEQIQEIRDTGTVVVKTAEMAKKETAALRAKGKKALTAKKK